MTYQEAYNQLQAIVEEVETEAVPLDELPDRIRLATDLIAFCQNRLRAVEVEYLDALERISKR
ncbi:exodeoxyribonuclease VII small subunit [Arsenicibacter rosenii]|uniref:Exodeoxyribonuclease VII small subunit n=1 Tax=Arsenicibacter rosenii TaxID=1750698 RepID=A0A1S2VMA2_9BACT|nr:exodeoxyribonuclease VII small subunit [Arsenicibacter rosenii]OIN59907.1 exodeoxyribonuclease VII small subunit [Arsenicibacter rosenii]